MTGDARGRRQVQRQRRRGSKYRAGGGSEEIEQLMADREPVYLECASLVIDGTRPPQELAAKVVATFTTLSDTRET